RIPGFGQCSDTFRLSIAAYRPHHRILNRDLSLAVNLELYTNPSGGPERVATLLSAMRELSSSSDPSGKSASRSSWHWSAVLGPPPGCRTPHLRPASCGCGPPHRKRDGAPGGRHTQMAARTSQVRSSCRVDSQSDTSAGTAVGTIPGRPSGRCCCCPLSLAKVAPSPTIGNSCSW